MNFRRATSLARLAWRESRTARRRLLLYMSSIALGVAALVAIDSFAANVNRSIRDQSLALLGGDLTFGARQAFPERAVAILDSLEQTGSGVAYVTTFASMTLAPQHERTRLAQVRVVSEGYPFYGEVISRPAEQWPRLHEGHYAMADPSLLISLGASVGDTLRIGFTNFIILAELEQVPGDPGVAAAIGPRVFVSDRWLEDMGLLGFGSRAEFEAVVRLPDDVDADEFIRPFRAELREQRVRLNTVSENESELTESIDELADFLGIVGLIALLLGGVGVASGVSAFVARKMDAVAVLRCLGATSGQVLAIYSVQAALMGLAGAAAGALLGIGIQLMLPGMVSELLPVDVSVRIEPLVVLMGLGIGVWVALVFALRPLLTLRNVSPLQALRRDTDPAVLRGRWRDPARLSVDALLAGSVLFLAIQRAESWQQGLGFAAGIALVLAALWLSASLLSRLARGIVNTRWPYVVRQGMANLYRPANQTRAVVVALGFGAFLVSTLYLTQTNLLSRFESLAESARGNLVFFDVQDDQVDGIATLVRDGGERVVEQIPIVNMRVARINQWTMDQMTDTTNPDGVRRAMWALRREYRSTFRQDMVDTESLLAGRWFNRNDTGLPEVSMEREVAEDLAVQLGDTITWDVQGVEIPTLVTSIREVEWARFEPNFFAVFEPQAISDAPKQWVILAAATSDERLAVLQRDAVDRFPNVSSIDLSLIRRTIAAIVEKVTVAVRFLALFSLAMGIPVLFSAVAASRRARVREGVLLKTLGATRGQIRSILLSEYFLLGLLAALAGMVLSFGGAWALLTFVFEQPFNAAVVPALAIAGVMVLVTVVIGLLGARDVFRETPMAALRAD